jgi:hypothetical protein
VGSYLGAITSRGGEFLSEVEMVCEMGGGLVDVEAWAGSSGGSKVKGKRVVKVSLNIMLPVKKKGNVVGRVGSGGEAGGHSSDGLEESMRHWEVCCGFAEINEDKLEGRSFPIKPNRKCTIDVLTVSMFI